MTKGSGIFCCPSRYAAVTVAIVQCRMKGRPGGALKGFPGFTQARTVVEAIPLPMKTVSIKSACGD
jgi:hypothetical protein